MKFETITSNLKFFALLLLIFILLQVFFLTDFWVHFDYKVYDTFVQFRGVQELSGDILIANIDQDTFDSIETYSWPYPRTIYAKLIENIFEAGAKLLVVDIEFTEPRDAVEDSVLAATCAKYRDRLVLAGSVLREQHAGYLHERIIPPIQPLQDAGIPWGVVNIHTDSDGFVRHYSLFQKYRDNNYYSLGVLGLALLNDGLEQMLTNIEDGNPFRIDGEHPIEIPKFGSNTSMIRYYGSSGTFQWVPFYQIVDDMMFDISEFDLDSYENHILADNILKDKIVLLGSTLKEHHDYFSTPFYSGLTPGVEIHANFMEMCLHHDTIDRFPFIWWLLIQFMLFLVLSYLFVRISPSISLIVTIVLIVASLCGTYQLISRLDTYAPNLEIPVLILLLYFISLLRHYIRTSREKRQIRNAFRQYMAPELVNELLRHPEKLRYGGEEKVITVLFSDIRSFTTYTESHPPQETVAMLREYLTAMVDCIIRHNGTLDKFVGDEIMALFGVPVELKNHALIACRVALEMRVELEKLQEKWRSEGKQIFEIGIGLNSGPATVGNLGSEQIFDYTAIGDNINLGARLEALNKEYDAEHKIILSDRTLKFVEDLVDVRYLGEVKVKGKEEAVKIYSLIGLKET